MSVVLNSKWAWSLASVWAVGVVFGVRSMTDFDTTPGKVAPTAATWPAGSSIPAPHSRPMVVVFAHPQCPCTAATIEILRQMAIELSEPAITVVVFERTGAAIDVESTALYRSARSIPGSQIVIDDGREAHRLGAETSGETLVFDANGTLLFAGGVTAVRGEPGSSVGSNAVLACIEGRVPATRSTPTYGCALFSKDSHP